MKKPTPHSSQGGGTSRSQMVHFSPIAMIHKEKVVPFPDIVRGTFVLTNIGDRFLTMEQVSEYLQIPKNTLYKYTSKNTTRRQLRGVRIGRALRFRLSDVDKWLEELEVI